MGQARQPGADSGPGAAASRDQADGRPAVRPARESAGTDTQPAARGRTGSDRYGDRQSRHRRPLGDRQPAAGQEVTAMDAADQATEAGQAAPGKPVREPWRRRLLHALLYGRNVDRASKARARIGLVVLIFAVGYAVLAARLVMFATAPEGHGARRALVQDAVATARPDILDRNGEILATDVRTPSLFGEPHRIIDVDEASELLTAVMTDIDAGELRERLASKRRFVWLKREIT